MAPKWQATIMKALFSTSWNVEAPRSDYLFAPHLPHTTPRCMALVFPGGFPSSLQRVGERPDILVLELFLKAAV